MGASAVQNGATKGGISTCVGDDDAFHTSENAVFVACRRKLHFHGVAFDVVIERFLSAIFDFDGAFGDPCHEGGIRLDGHVFFAAETAADERRTAVNALFWPAKHGRRFALYVVDRLARRIEQ